MLLSVCAQAFFAGFFLLTSVAYSNLVQQQLGVLREAQRTVCFPHCMRNIS